MMNSIWSSASPVLWMGFGIAAFAWPIYLGLLIGDRPNVRAFFDGDRSQWFAFWWTTVGALWLVTLSLAFVMARAGVPLSAIGAFAPSRVLLLIAAILVIAFGVGARSTGIKVSSPGPTDRGLIFLPHTLNERLFMVFVIAPTAALCEEIVYRGFVLRLLSAVTGFWIANIVQAALFGFQHGGVKQGGVAWFSRAAIGFVFGLVVISRGSLTLAILLHFVIDAAAALRPSSTTVTTTRAVESA